MRSSMSRFWSGLGLVGVLLVGPPARGEVLGFQLHLNGGITSITTGTGGGFHSDRNPLGIDLGVSTGIVPGLHLNLFLDAMSDFQHDGYFSAGARVLFALSDHFDLGGAGNVGYSVDFNARTCRFGWMVGPHLQFNVLLLNIFFQPSYADDVLVAGGVFYPLYGGVGVQL